MGYKLKSQLSEKQVEADVAGYFGFITPPGRDRFQLHDIDEQIYGADKRYDCVVPIFMQFKVSQGLKPIGMSKLPLMPLFPLQKIRIMRSNRGLNDDPTLYFKLREKAKHAHDYQHNILFELSKQNCHAFYVAPLVLKKTEYTDLLNPVNRFLNHPFYYAHSQVINYKNWVLSFGQVPFLRGHISIVPRETVRNANHYYSFSSVGTEIAFHSPDFYGYEVNRLSDTLQNILDGGKNTWLPIETFARKVPELMSTLQLGSSTFNDDRPIQLIYEFGDLLYKVFDIKMVLIFGERKYIY